jgi:hypothetical protein
MDGRLYWFVCFEDYVKAKLLFGEWFPVLDVVEVSREAITARTPEGVILTFGHKEVELRYGNPVTAYYDDGHPYYTRDDMARDIRHLRELERATGGMPDEFLGWFLWAENKFDSWSK